MKALSPYPALFSAQEADAANSRWKFNCGPASLCAALEMKPDAIRPSLLNFETKGHMNPSLMLQVLRALRVRYFEVYRGDTPHPQFEYPQLGLMRVQFDGPWTLPEVPPGARYIYTHWVALRQGQEAYEVFDINAIEHGGWMPRAKWEEKLLPWLMEDIPRANGVWWPTHVLDISKGGRYV